jgi:cell wall assembly regulator SMI1
LQASASYCRIRIAKDQALQRFAEWNGLPEVGPLKPITANDANEFAYDRPKEWREIAVVSEAGGWTLFNDLTGTFSYCPTARWLRLAGRDDLVFAAYSQELEYAEVLVLSGGAVVRQFRASEDGKANKDVGRLVSPCEPFKSWVEVARFVAGDELGFSNTGWLWSYVLSPDASARPPGGGVRGGTAETWQRVERWLSAHAPKVLARLPKGASEIALEEAEEVMGLALPQELRESLAIHDGADLYVYDSGRRDCPLGSPMAVREIAALHRRLVHLFGDGGNDEWAQPPPGVHGCWWHRAWVPALGHVNGDATCIDLDPAPGGVRGQVFGWAHDGGPGVVYAADYPAVLAGFAADLEAGRYAVAVSGRGEPYLDWAG